MKEENITFRSDSATKQQLKETSKRLSLKDSQFLRDAIWHYEEVLSQNKEAALLPHQILQHEATNKLLTQRLEAYETDKNLNLLFSKYKGHLVNGVRINSRIDLIRLIVAETTIAVEANTQDSELSVSPIKLSAELIQENQSLGYESWDVMAWVKRNWILTVLFFGGFIILLTHRWVSKLSKRPKIYKYQLPEKASNDFVSTKLNTYA
jgi:hypothetical protein